jgi:hypothetical protein
MHFDKMENDDAGEDSQIKLTQTERARMSEQNASVTAQRCVWKNSHYQT